MQALGARHAEAPRLRETTRLKEIRHAHTERVGDSPQRGNARAGAASLDLAQEALTETSALRDVAQRASARNANRPETPADIDFTRNLTHARRQRGPLRAIKEE